jgi:hypothetical protein
MVTQSEGCAHVSPQSGAYTFVFPSTFSRDVWMDDTHLNVMYDPTWGPQINPDIQNYYFNSTFQYVISHVHPLLSHLIRFTVSPTSKRGCHW